MAYSKDREIELTIEVLGFHNLQGEKSKNYKQLNYIRFKSNLLSDPRFIRLHPMAKLIYFFLMCEAGRNNTEKFKLRIDVISTSLLLRADFVRRRLLELQQFQLINFFHSTSTFANKTKQEGPMAPKANRPIFSHSNTKNSEPHNLDKEIKLIRLKYLESEENFAEENSNF